MALCHLKGVGVQSSETAAIESLLIAAPNDGPPALMARRRCATVVGAACPPAACRLCSSRCTGTGEAAVLLGDCLAAGVGAVAPQLEQAAQWYVCVR